MNPEFSKNAALATCFRNLKGSKTKELMRTARALKCLKELAEYRSNKELGEAVGVSGEIVRQFISLLDLPHSVQSLLEQGKLGLEQGRRLRQLHRKRPSIVYEAAREMCSMSAMETRDIVEYLIRTPDASVRESLMSLDAAKTLIEEEYHIDAILDGEAYRLLATHARNKKVSVNDLVSSIVSSWLEGDSDNDLS